MQAVYQMVCASMDEDQFRRLLQLGLGRAVVYAREHAMAEFRDLILDACLHCYAIYPQSEGARAAYMLDVLEGMPDRDFYCDQVLKALPGHADDWHAAQRFHFAACLAFDGNEQAKRTMYESFEPGPKLGELMAIDFLQMDGLAGLLFAAEKMGALIMNKPDEADQGHLLWRSIEMFGEPQTWDALRAAGRRNARIEAYRAAAEAHWKRQDSGRERALKISTAAYEELKPKLPDMRDFAITAWGERASNENLSRAALGLLAARSENEQLSHLRVFARRRFPLDPDVLAAFAASDQSRVRLAAVRALGRITHPAVRELAFRLAAARAEEWEEAVLLLMRNFQPGDHQIALGWFEAEQDREKLHSAGVHLRDFWKRHPDHGTEVRMLRTLYEKGPCSFCRESVVRRLIESNALNAELRAECAYDANHEIRRLAAGSVE